MTDEPEHQGNAIGCCGFFVVLIGLWVGIIWIGWFLVERFG